MFIVALYTIARNCPSTDKWITDIYIYILEYYSALNKNVITKVLEKWIDLEYILSKVTPIQKGKKNNL